MSSQVSYVHFYDLTTDLLFPLCALLDLENHVSTVSVFHPFGFLSQIETKHGIKPRVALTPGG